MASRSVVIVTLFYLFTVCNAGDVIDYDTCMANVNETIEEYSNDYDLFLQRKYNWIYEVALSYKDKLPQLPGYDLDDPQLCDPIDYAYEIFKRCGGIFIDDGTYKPNFENVPNVEDMCNWLVVKSTEFYAQNSKNKQVSADCDFNAELDSYNYQHGLCWKEHIGTK